MFERFTEAARKAVFFARYEASQSGSPYMEVEHLLLGVLQAEGYLLLRLLRSRAKVESIRRQILREFPAREKTATSVDLPVSTGLKRVFAHAAEAARMGSITAGHLLLGICLEESSTAAQLLRAHGVTAAQVRDELAPDAAGEEAEEPGTPARDLLEEAVIAGPGELVGRERELDRVIHILARRTKNNAALIGEAGVGKSAIARGLARRIAAGDVPAPLAERHLVSMDASALAGARERETPFDEPGAIVFIRGLFNLAAAGSAWAAVEAMHAIEPYLARGDIQCIATGSPAGLRETMEKAGMLARHFEVVNVAPASVEEAVRIVTGLKAAFEKFHGVTFAEGAVEAAVAISGRFLPGRHLPDRAIDLVDEAATAVRLRRGGEKTVTVADVEAAVATRAGVPAEAVRRALDEKQAGEAERIAGLLAAQVPAEEGEWVPYLAGWLARHSPEEAEALARAIAAARQPDN